MSAARRNDRRVARNVHASPYARPAQSSKSSSWSLRSLFNFFNPLRSRGSAESHIQDDLDENTDVRESMDVVEEISLTDPIESLVNGELVPQNNNAPSPSPSPPPQQAQPPQSPAQNLSIRGHQLAQNFADGGSTSYASSSILQTPSRYTINLNIASPLGNSPVTISPGRSSLARNIEPVTRFLVEKEKTGQPLNDFEAAEIVEYIQRNVTDDADKPEPFRFSTTPSRSTSPGLVLGQPLSPTSTPSRKTLTKNPNGVYRWQGGGSARPRNRYQSPAFASRPTPPSIKLPPPTIKPSSGDSKRRRISEDSLSSTPLNTFIADSPLSIPRPEAPTPPVVQPSVRAQASSIAVSHKVTSSSVSVPPPVPTESNGVHVSRVRATGRPIKPTTPAVPSPLRQAWSQGDSSPPQHTKTTPSRPTKAASYMTELIKEVTPPKKPDLSNPYQTASPVKPVTKRPSSRKIPLSEKPRTERSKDKEPAMSAQAIIEATQPKGSRRSRPNFRAADTERSDDSMALAMDTETVEGQPTFAHISNGSIKAFAADNSQAPAVTEEANCDDESPSPVKKQKRASVVGSPLASFASRPDSSLSVEEVENAVTKSSSTLTRPAEVIEPKEDDQSMKGRQINTTPFPTIPTPLKSAFGFKSSIPKEPSKLRFSFQAEKSEPCSEPINPHTYLHITPSLSSVSQPTPSPATKFIEPKAAALSVSEKDLPVFTFTSDVPSSSTPPAHIEARATALAASVSSLPVYAFPQASTSYSKTIYGQASSTQMDVRRSTSGGFDWSAAGMKAPSTSGEKWTCSTCMLTNSDDAREKCAVCEASRPDRKPAVTKAAGFDWSAAGMRSQSALSGGGTWTCSTCMLSNPATATDKCTICDSPR